MVAKQRAAINAQKGAMTPKLQHQTRSNTGRATSSSANGGYN